MSCICIEHVALQLCRIDTCRMIQYATHRIVRLRHAVTGRCVTWHAACCVTWRSHDVARLCDLARLARLCDSASVTWLSYPNLERLNHPYLEWLNHVNLEWLSG